MTTDIVFLAICLLAFAGFTAFVYFKYGIQTSISASIHVLHGAFEKSLYSWFILGVAVPMMIVSGTTLGVWAGILLSIDAAAPAGGDKLQNFLHCFGADVGMALGLLMLWVDYHLWPIVVVALIYIAFLQFRKFENRTWWIECVAFGAVWVGLLWEKVLQNVLHNL